MSAFKPEHAATLRRLADQCRRRVDCGIDDRCDEADAIAAALAEIERLNEESRRYYWADGTYGVLDSPEAVVERRKEAAREIERLRSRYEPPPGKCEHGVFDGDWCEPCNKDYNDARLEADHA